MWREHDVHAAVRVRVRLLHAVLLLLLMHGDFVLIPGFADLVARQENAHADAVCPGEAERGQYEPVGGQHGPEAGPLLVACARQPLNEVVHLVVWES